MLPNRCEMGSRYPSSGLKDMKRQALNVLHEIDYVLRRKGIANPK